MTRPDFIHAKISVAEVNALRSRAEAAESELTTLRARVAELMTFITASKASFEAYIREMRRPEIGDDADEWTEANLLCDLAEPGWPDSCRWSELWHAVDTGAELTPRQRMQALAYWEAGEDYPPDDMRLDPCAASDCPLRALNAPKENADDNG